MDNINTLFVGKDKLANVYMVDFMVDSTFMQDNHVADAAIGNPPTALV
jgi:hypothetical protein